MFYFSVLDQKKYINLVREGGENKHLKKNTEPIFGRVNEDDQIKKTLDKFIEKLVGFGGNRQQSNARAGQKKTHVFFW